MNTLKIELVEGYEEVRVSKVNIPCEPIAPELRIDVYPNLTRYLVKFYDKLREISKALGVKRYLIERLRVPLEEALEIIFSNFPPETKVDLDIDVIEDYEVQNWKMLRIAFIITSNNYNKLQEIWSIISKTFAEKVPKELSNTYYVAIEPRRDL